MSQSNSSLAGALHETATADTRAEIVRHLWKTQTSSPLLFENRDWDAYFSYYARECSAALVDQGKHISIRTHADLLRTTHLLEDEPSEAEVVEKLRQTLTQRWLPTEEQQMLDGSVRLAARLLLMVNIGPLPSEVTAKLTVAWKQGSLQQSIHDHFGDSPAAVADPKYNIIAVDLTCRNIERVAGIEIVPTDNLVDHLRLVDRDKKLCVFHHVAFLKQMQTVKWFVAPWMYLCRIAEYLAAHCFRTALWKRP